MESSKSILLGRTGSGKSALMMHLEQCEENSVRIDPNEFAFNYLANSNIISFVSELGCDLNVLYGYLWKHVMLCKIVGLYFENRTALNRAIDTVSNRNNQALQYVKEYEGQFWINHDETVKEISENFESSLNNHLKGVVGDGFAKVELGLGGEIRLNNSQKKQIVSRVRKATSDIQIQKLAGAINGLNDILIGKAKKFYLLVDDLDADWTESDLKYQMIRSLVECIKSFRKIRNIKIIVCLRSDVYERSILSHRGEGYQPEKFEGNYSEIRWSINELKKLADRRIGEVFKEKYVKTNVKYSSVFPQKIRNQDSFSYLCERTQYRPRDLIAFLNLIFDQAAGSSTLTEKMVSLAETEYSRKRYDALQREWEIIHPNLAIYLQFLKGHSGNIKFTELATKQLIEDLSLEVQSSDHYDTKDDLDRACSKYFQKQTISRLETIARCLIATLYKVGAIELMDLSRINSASSSRLS